METTPTYNDVDILISVDLSSNPSTIQKVKTAVLDALMQFVPQDFGITSPNVNTFSPHSNYASVQYVFGNVSTPEGISFDPDNKDVQLRPSDLVSVNHAALPANRRSSETSNTSQLDSINEAANLTNAPIARFLSVDEEECDVLAPNLNNPYLVPNIMFPEQHNPPIHRVPTDYGSLNSAGMAESYVYKQFRKFSPQETDCWSLLSLGMPETDSKVIEFKFVDRMRRQFEFTVDSFQIHLDSMLSFIYHHPPNALNINFYPTVVAESVAGSFTESLYHLQNKLIITSEPEMIRGGGLLKYCRLISIDYRAPEGIDACSLERYMSSRFFIDFQDLESQRLKLESFLHNHFAQHAHSEKIDFLKTFYRVVNGSAVCLMSHERYQTLALTSSLMEQLNQQTKVGKSFFCLTSFAEMHNLTLDKIYMGKHLFPSTAASPEYRCSYEHQHDPFIAVGYVNTNQNKGDSHAYDEKPKSMYDIKKDTMGIRTSVHSSQHTVEDVY